ncbi:MAG: histidine phosphatase family protein [Dehalococcoidia bacterium]|nr:histidine phosphatase family protein [Dehalococcoidia bacterium]
MRLVLVRHGETVWNQERKIQGGTSDTELSEVGRKQAEGVGLSLKGMEISAIYSSPLKRALDTAQAIASHHQLEVQVEPDLREIDAGDLEGRSIVELGTTFSQFLLRWRQGQGSEKMPGGESVIDVANRVWSVIQRIVSKHDQGTVVVASHYFVTVVAICKALGWPLTNIERIRVQNGSVSVLEFRETRTCLVSLGDVCHLREG